MMNPKYVFEFIPEQLMQVVLDSGIGSKIPKGDYRCTMQTLTEKPEVVKVVFSFEPK